jgi:hypothetical protein
LIAEAEKKDETEALEKWSKNADFLETELPNPVICLIKYQYSRKCMRKGTSGVLCTLTARTWQGRLGAAKCRPAPLSSKDGTPPVLTSP